MSETYEEFTEYQLNVLEKFVTSTTSNVFALRGLPEVIKGALFSRYSRSTLGLRSLLLKEFILNEETSFTSILERSHESETSQDQGIAIQKAQNFYDRILDGYGDDSIGELGGAHLAIENVSMLAAKEIEDCRIGGSPLEKSTRYIYFDQKVRGEYLFYHEPVLMASAYRDLFLGTCNHLFDTYSRLIPPLTAQIEKSFPQDPHISKTAYTAALRAKVLDCLRGLLPAGALTSMGVFGNGRFFEQLIQKMHSHKLFEMQELGRTSYEELAKVIPSFIRRAHPTHRHCQTYATYAEALAQELRTASRPAQAPDLSAPGVRLIDHDPHCVTRIAAALLFKESTHSLAELQTFCQHWPEEKIEQLFRTIAAPRNNRRHKSPRALECASFSFELVADFGVYRDLHRHRMLTQERQLLTCNHGYYIPPEICDTPMESEYRDAMDCAQRTYRTIAEALPEEAQYVVPMAYHVRWYVHANLRALQWLTELRSQPAGHPTYRWIAQELAREVTKAYPALGSFFQFVDFSGHPLGRLEQEIRTEEKRAHGLLSASL